MRKTSSQIIPYNPGWRRRRQVEDLKEFALEVELLRRAIIFVEGFNVFGERGEEGQEEEVLLLRWEGLELFDIEFGREGVLRRAGTWRLGGATVGGRCRHGMGQEGLENGRVVKEVPGEVEMFWTRARAYVSPLRVQVQVDVVQLQGAVVANQKLPGLTL